MKRLLLLTLTALLAGSAASGIQAKTHALKWGPAPAGLPKGAEVAVVSGNPEKAGPFAIRLKSPADYAVPPHHHPSNEVVKLLSGTLHYGMSDKLDMAKAKTLTAGH